MESAIRPVITTPRSSRGSTVQRSIPAAQLVVRLPNLGLLASTPATTRAPAATLCRSTSDQAAASVAAGVCTLNSARMASRARSSAARRAGSSPAASMSLMVAAMPRPDGGSGTLSLGTLSIVTRMPVRSHSCDAQETSARNTATNFCHMTVIRSRIPAHGRTA